jgi:putative Holliday junction resolvase
MPEVLLGLDYGRKRIGIAVSTPLGTVHPRPRLERTTPSEDIAALCAVAEECGAEGIVVGLPHHMDGAVSEMEREARAFAARVGAVCGLPVYGTDERLTTEAAETILRAQENSGRKRRKRRDSAAACLLLGDFIIAGDSKRERIE